jgi:ABC-type transport system involved in multi-copper enzyme maturation permease subunit
MNSKLFDADNPLLRRELLYQQRNASGWWRKYKEVFASGVVVVVALLLCITRIEAILWIFWGIHVAMAVHTITAGTDMISREFTRQTWDALILTGISARKILWSKWLAVLPQVWKWIILIWISRFLMSFLLIYLSGIDEHNETFQWDTQAFVFGIVITIALPILELCCYTILGISVSAVCRNRIGAMILGLGVRFAPVILFGSVLVSTYNRGHLLYSREMALADSGTFSTMALLVPYTRFEEAEMYMLASHNVLTAVGMLFTIFLISVSAALIAMRRAGASPHRRS